MLPITIGVNKVAFRATLNLEGAMFPVNFRK